MIAGAESVVRIRGGDATVTAAVQHPLPASTHDDGGPLHAAHGGSQAGCATAARCARRDGLSARIEAAGLANSKPGEHAKRAGSVGENDARSVLWLGYVRIPKNSRRVCPRDV